MNIKDLKEIFEQLKKRRNSDEKEAFWAAQRERISQLSPQERKAEIEAIGQRVEEIGQVVDKDKSNQAA